MNFEKERSSKTYQKDRIFIRAPEGVSEFLERPYEQVAVMIICTPNCTLTSKKITDNLCGIRVFRKLDEFGESLSFTENETSSAPSILIDMPIADCINKMNLFGMKRKVFLITRENVDDVVSQVEKLSINTKLVQDTIKWDDLSEEQRTRVLEKLQTSYQGKLDLEDVEKLEWKLLVDLISDRKPVLFKNTIPPKINCYVKRKLVSRNVVSKQIFKHQENNDVFVITGMEESDLPGVEKSQTDISQRQINQNKVTVRFILMGTNSDFEDICKITQLPVHWLQTNDNGITWSWVKSRGNVRTIQNYVQDHDSQRIIDEDQFLEILESNNQFGNSTGPVLISDSLGMGKSVVLGNLGLKLQTKYPDRLVIFIIFSEFYADLKNVSMEITSDNLVDALARQVSEYELGRKMFIEGIKTGNTRLELLIDGFDEVRDQEGAVQCLKLISNSFQNVRLWVTIPSELLEQLENHLDTIGYTLEAFDVQDQFNFLVEYWSSSREHVHLDYNLLIRFARSCLEVFQSRMNEKERHIAGVPLQCMLIAEVFQEDAVKYANTKNTKYFRPPDIFINSITDLYACTIDKKIHEYKTKNPDTDVNKKMIIYAHVHLSLSLLIPGITKKFEERFNLPDKSLKDILFKVGLLEPTGNPQHHCVRFIHRTFAEYFVAKFVLDCLRMKEWNDEITQFLVDHLFATKTNRSLHSKVDTRFFDLEVVCFFIDSLLTNFDLSTVNSAVHKQLAKYLDSERLAKICHACVCSDFVNIFKLLDAMQLLHPYGKDIFNEKLVLASVHFSGIELVSIACEKFIEYQSIPVKSLSSVFHGAVKRGDYLIAEYLLRSHGFDQLVKKGKLKLLLHDCVKGTKAQGDNIIDDKIGVVKLLCGINRKILEEMDGRGCTPILCDELHTRLIEELLNLGAKVSSM